MYRKHPLYDEISRGVNWITSATNDNQFNANNLPKKQRAYLLIACSGEQGITENEILRACRLSSGRNYITDLERALNIDFKRNREGNPDGIGGHYRYYLANKDNAQKVINYILRDDFTLLSQWEVLNILDLYPDKVA